MEQPEQARGGAPLDGALPNSRIVFVGGLHRSGTSLVQQCLRQHPDVSGMVDTGVAEDEGQHLQDVYPTAQKLGGPGRFGFHPKGHLTEESNLLSDANRRRLWQEWEKYWNTLKPFLVEKSPPNLIRGRFLQALFPESCFIMVVRHPVAVALATAARTRRGAPLDGLIEHWLVCHELLRSDAPHIERLCIVPYERLVADPDVWLDRLQGFLGCERRPISHDVRSDINGRYFKTYAELRGRRFSGRSLRQAESRLEGRVQACGYSLADLEVVRPDEALWPSDGHRLPDG